MYKLFSNRRHNLTIEMEAMDAGNIEHQCLNVCRLGFPVNQCARVYSAGQIFFSKYLRQFIKIIFMKIYQRAHTHTHPHTHPHTRARAWKRPPLNE